MIGDDLNQITMPPDEVINAIDFRPYGGGSPIAEVHIRLWMDGQPSDVAIELTMYCELGSCNYGFEGFANYSPTPWELPDPPSKK